MAGVTLDEGALITQAMFAREQLITSLEANFSKLGTVSLHFEKEDEALNLPQRIYDYYLGGVFLDKAHSEQLAKMYSDVHIGLGHDLVTKFHARHAHGRNTFRYELVYRGQLSLGDFGNTQVGKHWVFHGDDLYYLFTGGPLLQPTERLRIMRAPKDVRLRNIVTTLWANFAATG
ncbi:juvenile hormone esterase-like [Panulirus ornatus]|uniref:juvenile hormone esterase-like n=1 Tax=Panulirus ornatus TaxID=150431 RepID=UPI003A8C57B3